MQIGLATATWLFARHGFNGVTQRRIADAAGLDISTVHHHVGAKRHLYLAVIRRIDIEERRMDAGFENAAVDSVSSCTPASPRKRTC